MRHPRLILKLRIQAYQQCCLRLFTLLLGLLICVACTAEAANASGHRWTQFVQVEGQPEPVPAEWAATPEGKFAHSIKVPNSLPKDSGYRPGMTSDQYFDHLCKTEGGEFIYKTAENVEGFYFMRPPKQPTDDDFQDRYKLEAPEIERTFQLLDPSSNERVKIFVNPHWALYSYVEEPNLEDKARRTFIRFF